MEILNSLSFKVVEEIPPITSSTNQTLSLTLDIPSPRKGYLHHRRAQSLESNRTKMAMIVVYRRYYGYTLDTSVH